MLPVQDVDFFAVKRVLLGLLDCTAVAANKFHDRLEGLKLVRTRRVVPTHVDCTQALLCAGHPK